MKGEEKDFTYSVIYLKLHVYANIFGHCHHPVNGHFIKHFWMHCARQVAMDTLVLKLSILKWCCLPSTYISPVHNGLHSAAISNISCDQHCPGLKWALPSSLCLICWPDFVDHELCLWNISMTGAEGVCLISYMWCSALWKHWFTTVVTSLNFVWLAPMWEWRRGIELNNLQLKCM